MFKEPAIKETQNMKEEKNQRSRSATNCHNELSDVMKVLPTAGGDVEAGVGSEKRYISLLSVLYKKWLLDLQTQLGRGCCNRSSQNPGIAKKGVLTPAKI